MARKNFRNIVRRRWNKWWRSLKRRMRKMPLSHRILLGISLLIALIAIYNANMPAYHDADYTPLLNTIAKGESKGNYNAYFDHVNNTSIRFTDMTVAEVLQWQKDHVAQGSPSSAVGRYQILRPTLLGLIKELKIDPAKTRFDAKTQDKLGIALLEKRGAHKYVKGKLSRDEFALNLSKEWASLPKVVGPNPTQSYYAGDGLNEVQITIDEIFHALATIKS